MNNEPSKYNQQMKSNQHNLQNSVILDHNFVRSNTNDSKSESNMHRFLDHSKNQPSNMNQLYGTQPTFIPNTRNHNTLAGLTGSTQIGDNLHLNKYQNDQIYSKTNQNFDNNINFGRLQNYPKKHSSSKESYRQKINTFRIERKDDFSNNYSKMIK